MADATRRHGGSPIANFTRAKLFQEPGKRTQAAE